MRYLLLPTEQACSNLSRALWRIHRPSTTAASEGDRTLFLFSWHKHPTLDQWAVEFDETYQYPKHALVNAMLDDSGDAFGSRAFTAQAFSPLAADGRSLAATLTHVKGRSSILAGDLLQFVNPSLIKTKAEMDADGWFPEPAL